MHQVGRVAGRVEENSGLQNSASNGHTSMQMPEYMHSAKSIAKRSSTLRLRGRPPGWVGGTGSLCDSRWMHHTGHSRAHSVHTVQFSSNSATTPRLRGGSGTSG